MKIAIDARLLNTKIRGTARYLMNLIKYLPQFDNKNEYYLFQYENIPQNISFYNYITIKKNQLPRQLYEHYWLNFRLPKILEELKIDIFFTPYIFVPLTKKKWKNVIVIHDALTKVCKQYYTWHYRKYMDIMVPPSIKRSDFIVTVSECAKKDIMKYYSISEDRIQHLYLWTDEKYKPLILTGEYKEKLLKKYNLPEEFILFVGVLEERKNISGIIKISDLLYEKRVNIKILLVGREGFNFKKIVSELNKRKDRIIHINDIEDEDLVGLYNLAKIFLFPTFCEGFGIPPLEAMKCGLPIVASNNSSMPEVVGDGGLLGKANDYEFFADSIIKLLENKFVYNQMKSKALLQANKFTAEKHISKLVELFNSLL